MSRLLTQYRSKIVPELQKQLLVGNVLAVPRLQKIVVNVGLGKQLAAQPKALENFVQMTQNITGQHPVQTRAKKAISGFKVRENQIVGLVVTLRGKRMYDFLDKLINAGLPRTRDFRGLSRNGFDGRGNYSLGLRENIVFPEMAQEEAQNNFGLQITIATTAKTDERGYALLKKFGFPFKD